MFCGKCGNEIKEGENFCSQCGARVNNQDSGIDEKTVHTSDEQLKKDMKKYTKIVLIGIPVLVISLLGLSIWITNASRPKDIVNTQSKNDSNLNIKSNSNTSQKIENSAIKSEEILYYSQYSNYNEERQTILDIAYKICTLNNVYDIPQEIKIWDLDGQGRYIINIKRVNKVSGEWDNVNRIIGYVKSEEKYYTNYQANILLGYGNASDFNKVKSYVNWGKTLQTGEDF